MHAHTLVTAPAPPARPHDVPAVPDPALDAPTPETELARRFRDGDPAALRAAYDRHAQVVFALALRALGTHHDAEDLTSRCSSAPGGRARRSTPHAAPWAGGRRHHPPPDRRPPHPTGPRTPRRRTGRPGPTAPGRLAVRPSHRRHHRGRRDEHPAPATAHGAAVRVARRPDPPTDRRPHRATAGHREKPPPAAGWSGSDDDGRSTVPVASPDQLALAALPAEPVEPDVAAHLHTCRTCRATVAALAHTVDIARDGTTDPATDPEPPPRVWHAITAEARRRGPTPPPPPLPSARWRRLLVPVTATAASLAAGLILGLAASSPPRHARADPTHTPANQRPGHLRDRRHRGIRRFPSDRHPGQRTRPQHPRGVPRGMADRHRRKTAVLPGRPHPRTGRHPLPRHIPATARPAADRVRHRRRIGRTIRRQPHPLRREPAPRPHGLSVPRQSTRPHITWRTAPPGAASATTPSTNPDLRQRPARPSVSPAESASPFSAGRERVTASTTGPGRRPRRAVDTE